MPRLLTYYSFIITTAMVALGFLSAQTLPQLISAALFSPLAIYFFLQVLPRRNHSVHIPKIVLAPAQLEPEPSKPPLIAKSFDFDRRAFLKLIGSAGISVFLFSLFTKNAEGAFFGSVPGPGTVSLKDSAGNKIDPSEKQPTDGFKINQLDDSAPAYYGFTKKGGAWFIMKEDATGNYRYTKGLSGFPINWTNRASLTYDYYDNIF